METTSLYTLYYNIKIGDTIGMMPKGLKAKVIAFFTSTAKYNLSHIAKVVQVEERKKIIKVIDKLYKECDIKTITIFESTIKGVKTRNLNIIRYLDKKKNIYKYKIIGIKNLKRLYVLKNWYNVKDNVKDDIKNFIKSRTEYSYDFTGAIFASKFIERVCKILRIKKLGTKNRKKTICSILCYDFDRATGLTQDNSIVGTSISPYKYVNFAVKYSDFFLVNTND